MLVELFEAGSLVEHLLLVKVEAVVQAFLVVGLRALILPVVVANDLFVEHFDL